jgi:hypothetical protein
MANSPQEVTPPLVVKAPVEPSGPPRDFRAGTSRANDRVHAFGELEAERESAAEEVTHVQD